VFSVITLGCTLIPSSRNARWQRCLADGEEGQRGAVKSKRHFEKFQFYFSSKKYASRGPHDGTQPEQATEYIFFFVFLTFGP
jgi:hypothetical protein